MDSSFFVSAADLGFRRSRVLLTLLLIAMIVQAASAQEWPLATPVDGPAESIVGSITLIGWDGVERLSFVVSDESGNTLESGVLDTDYYQSSLLVVEPGARGSVTLIGTESSFQIAAVHPSAGIGVFCAE